MKNKVKDIGIKNRLDDIINIKIFDLNNIEIDEKFRKKIRKTIKDSKYLKFNSVNPLYIIINKVTGYFEGIDLMQNINFTEKSGTL